MTAHIPSFVIRADHYLAVSCFISNEETRYYLNGVHRAECGELVATDGVSFGRVRPEYRGQVEAFEPVTILATKDLIALAKKKEVEFLLFQPDGVVIGYFNDPREPEDTKKQGAALWEETGGTFPDYNRIIPGEDTAYELSSAFGMNLATVAKFAKAGAALGNKNVVAAFHTKEAASPARVTLGGFPEFLGVIMPCRV